MPKACILEASRLDVFQHLFGHLFGDFARGVLWLAVS